MENEKNELENNNVEKNEVNKNNENKILSVVSMVLGLVGLLVCAIPCGIASIVLSLIGRKKGGRGFATAGFILGIADIVCGIIVIVLLIIKAKYLIQ